MVIDPFEILDKALADDRGVRIKFGNQGDAIQLRLRLHRARVKEQERNTRAYEPGHELYGRSIYDGLVVRVVDEQDGHYVYVEHNSIASGIEPLSAGTVVPSPGPASGIGSGD